jgi:phosphatidylethanolamine/phosphatidyl-N-methylethanolamine N-methyltransferase
LYQTNGWPSTFARARREGQGCGWQSISGRSGANIVPAFAGACGNEHGAAAPETHYHRKQDSMTIESNGYVSRDLDRPSVEKAYAGWAPVYDIVFGPMFLHARRAAIACACQVGGRVLEVGVGTGLSFPHYDEGMEVYGIDISQPMIARARKRLAGGKFPGVKTLEVMDAHNLAFPDRFFDCVVAQFVITLVESPERVLSECLRVLKPRGEIILASHFYSERGILAALERLCARPATAFGLRLEFPFARVEEWLRDQSDVRLVERRTLPLTHTIVRLKRVGPDDPSGPLDRIAAQETRESDGEISEPPGCGTSY